MLYALGWLQDLLTKKEGSPMDEHSKQGLYRYREAKWLGGVFAGISDKWGLNLMAMRVVFMVLLLFIVFSWAIVLVYVTLWAILPLRGPQKKKEKDLDPGFQFDPQGRDLIKSFKDAVESGNYAEAIKHGREFIAQTPEHEDKEKMERNIKVLNEKLEAGS